MEIPHRMIPILNPAMTLLTKSTCQAAVISFWIAGALLAASPVIRPGEIWLDNRGQHIQAHGGGIIRLRDTYYWFGEDRSKENDRAKRYVSCYSSKD